MLLPLGGWICPLVVVRISLLVIRKDFIGLLDLSCRTVYGQSFVFMASACHRHGCVLAVSVLTRLNSYSAFFLSSGFALSG